MDSFFYSDLCCQKTFPLFRRIDVLSLFMPEIQFELVFYFQKAAAEISYSLSGLCEISKVFGQAG